MALWSYRYTLEQEEPTLLAWRDVTLLASSVLTSRILTSRILTSSILTKVSDLSDPVFYKYFDAADRSAVMGKRFLQAF
jgi:hypothetical protein